MIIWIYTTVDKDKGRTNTKTLRQDKRTQKLHDNNANKNKTRKKQRQNKDKYRKYTVRCKLHNII